MPCNSNAAPASVTRARRLFTDACSTARRKIHHVHAAHRYGATAVRLGASRPSQAHGPRAATGNPPVLMQMPKRPSLPPRERWSMLHKAMYHRDAAAAKASPGAAPAWRKMSQYHDAGDARARRDGAARYPRRCRGHPAGSGRRAGHPTNFRGLRHRLSAFLS